MALFEKKQPSDAIKTLLENLCHLEINTIIKPGMTAQKMPVPEGALVDLAEMYAQSLAPGDLPAPFTVGPKRYAEIHKKAGDLLAKSVAEERTEREWMIARLRDHRFQIMGVYESLAKRTTTLGELVRDEVVNHPLELVADEM